MKKIESIKGAVKQPLLLVLYNQLYTTVIRLPHGMYER